MTKEDYADKYHKNLKEIGIVFLYLIIGLLLVGMMSQLWQLGGYEFNQITDYAGLIPLIAAPYGIRKTWRSFLVLQGGSTGAWLLWLVYFGVKLGIAVIYGAVMMSILLVINIVGAITHRCKMKHAPSEMELYMQNIKQQQFQPFIYGQQGYSQQPVYYGTYNGQ